MCPLLFYAYSTTVSRCQNARAGQQIRHKCGVCHIGCSRWLDGGAFCIVNILEPSTRITNPFLENRAFLTNYLLRLLLLHALENCTTASFNLYCHTKPPSCRFLKPSKLHPLANMSSRPACKSFRTFLDHKLESPTCAMALFSKAQWLPSASPIAPR